MPFLRLTRDRRGYENTYLMHADRPGDRPRMLYWYRTAPGITLGRPPLDEEAIRSIEESHPDIDFDWPAILALSEVMTPEEEAPARPAQREPRPAKRRGRDREAEGPRQPQRESRRDSQAAESDTPSEPDSDIEPPTSEAPAQESRSHSRPAVQSNTAPATPAQSTRPSGLVDQLAGREIASRLRGRYDDIISRIQDAEESARAGLLTRAEALNPDRWDTPEAVLKGVSNADALFEQLRAALG